MARAMPKSATFAVPSSVMRMFAGFTSRWTTPLRWANESASATWTAMRAAGSAFNFPWRRINWARVLPGTYSMAMKYVDPCWPQS